MLAARSGVEIIRLYGARHTHASLMLKAGTHSRIVQEKFGHASIQITLDTYSYVAPRFQQAVATRFDEAFNSRYNESANEVLKSIR